MNIIFEVKIRTGFIGVKDLHRYTQMTKVHEIFITVLINIEIWKLSLEEISLALGKFSRILS